MKGGLFSFLVAVFLAPVWGQAGTPPQKLAYGWKRGESHVYSVTIVLKEEGYSASARGQVIFTARAANPHGFTIRSHNFLSIQRHSYAGKLFPPFGIFRLGWRHFDGATGGRPLRAPVDVVIDPQGKLIGGAAPGFDLASPVRLVLETLPGADVRKWQGRHEIKLVHEQRNKVSPGSRLVKLGKTPLIADETSAYTLGDATGNLVQIQKEYRLATRVAAKGQPTMELVGKADLTFDTKVGLFQAMAFSGKLTVTEQDETRTVPVTVDYERLTGAKRQAALRPPRPANRIEMRPLPAEELNKTLALLKQRLSFPRLKAADRLAKAEPANRKAEVNAALLSVLTDSDPYTRQAVCRALAVWGEADAVPELIKRLKDSHPTVRWAALEALGRLADPRAAVPVAGHLASGSEPAPAIATLQAIGPAAEPSVRPLLRAKEQYIRHAACRLLGVLGSGRSALDLLAVQRGKDPLAAKLAKHALSQIVQRHSQ
ncbi:MAG: HEAT repeat domain-containing protein [Verrucomicrobiota bacterium]|nr:HEAT repeat domain-containing protein [Verrucomicrobiota bacterium]